MVIYVRHVCLQVELNGLFSINVLLLAVILWIVYSLFLSLYVHVYSLYVLFVFVQLKKNIFFLLEIGYENVI